MRGFEPERVGALRKAASGSFLAPRCAEAVLQARVILLAKAPKSPLEHQHKTVSKEAVLLRFARFLILFSLISYKMINSPRY